LDTTKKILKLNKFVISKLIIPLIKNNVAFYEVMWTGYKETTNEPRDELLKDVPK
jgi:hypothetical protein